MILRRTMYGLKLQLVGRDLYDAKAKIEVGVVTGYVTSNR